MSDVIRRRADGSWGQGDDVPTYASDHAETCTGTRDESMEHVSDEYAKQLAAQNERREDAGDSVFEISEIEKLKEEKHQLKVSVQFLVNEMKSFCFFHFHNGKCANYYHGCYQTCEFYKAIKKYDCLEGKQ